jgi:hypothetical protein
MKPKLMCSGCGKMANNGSAVVTAISSSKTGGYNRDNSGLERAVNKTNNIILVREKSNDDIYRNSD